MIVLHIEVKDEDLALSVVQHLLKNQLIYKAEYSQVSLFDSDSEIDDFRPSSGYAIRAKTKALLFQKIQKSLRKEFKKRIRALYATPIVYMENKQAEQLKSGTLAV